MVFNLIPFQGMYGLYANFSKTCLYSFRMFELPEAAAAATLNNIAGLLLVTYLSLPFLVEEHVSKIGKGLSQKLDKDCPLGRLGICRLVVDLRW